MAKKKAQAMTFEDLKDLIKENAKIRGGQLTQDDLDAFLDKYELDDETSEELLSFISDNDLLSEDDLEDISIFLSETIVKKISSSVKSQKEILDMDVSIEIDYPNENGELDVDASIEIDTDELSDLSSERIDEVIEESYLELDEYINEHYR